MGATMEEKQIVRSHGTEKHHFGLKESQNPLAQGITEEVSSTGFKRQRLQMVFQAG